MHASTIWFQVRVPTSINNIVFMTAQPAASILVGIIEVEPRMPTTCTLGNTCCVAALTQNTERLHTEVRFMYIYS